mgnify:FL=1|jgi:hypothetical protein
MIIETKGNVFLSKKGNHLVSNQQTLDLTKGSEKCVKTTQIIDVTDCTEEQVQQVKKLLENKSLIVETELA